MKDTYEDTLRNHIDPILQAQQQEINVGDTIVARDGREYLVTKHGWQRIQPAGEGLPMPKSSKHTRIKRRDKKRGRR